MQPNRSKRVIPKEIGEILDRVSGGAEKTVVLFLESLPPEIRRVFIVRLELLMKTAARMNLGSGIATVNGPATSALAWRNFAKLVAEWLQEESSAKILASLCCASAARILKEGGGE